MTHRPELIGVVASDRHVSGWAFSGDGVVLRSHHADAEPVVSAEEFTAAIKFFLGEWLGEWPDCPVLVSGAGAIPEQGKPAMLVPLPFRLDDIGKHLRLHENMYLMPGVRQDTPPDYLTGAECCLFGIEETSALVCLPGEQTHHVILEDGRIAGLATEVSAVLTGALSHRERKRGWRKDSQIYSEAVFRDWVEQSLDTEDAVSPFAVHAACVMGALRPEYYECALSGLMTGADVAAHYEPGDEVVLVADGEMLDRYALALETLGAEIVEYSAEETLRDGLVEIAEIAGLLDD